MTGPPGGRPRAYSRDRSVEREHQDGVAKLVVELEVAAGGDRDVLLAVHHERHRRGVDPGAGLERPELLAGRRVIGVEAAVTLAREHQVASRGQRAADHGVFGPGLPYDLSRVDVDRGDVTPLVLSRNRRERAAQPQLSLLPRLLLDRVG